MSDERPGVVLVFERPLKVKFKFKCSTAFLRCFPTVEKVNINKIIIFIEFSNVLGSDINKLMMHKRG